MNRKNSDKPAWCRTPKRKKSGGRQKGTANKITTEMRGVLKDFLLEKWPQVKRAFDKLEPKDQVVAFARFLPFMIPQYQSVNMSLSMMSEHDLAIILQHVKSEVTRTDPPTIDLDNDDDDIEPAGLD